MSLITVVRVVINASTSPSNSQAIFALITLSSSDSRTGGPLLTSHQRRALAWHFEGGQGRGRTVDLPIFSLLSHCVGSL